MYVLNHGEGKKVNVVYVVWTLFAHDRLSTVAMWKFQVYKNACVCVARTRKHVETISFTVGRGRKPWTDTSHLFFPSSSTGLRLLMCARECFPCGTIFMRRCFVCSPHRRTDSRSSYSLYICLFIVCVIIVAVIMPLEHFSVIKTVLSWTESKLDACTMCVRRVYVDYVLQQVKSNGWHQLQWLCFCGKRWEVSRWKKLKRKCERTNV